VLVTGSEGCTLEHFLARIKLSGSRRFQSGGNNPPPSAIRPVKATSIVLNQLGDTTMFTKTKIVLSLMLALGAVSGASATTKHPAHQAWVHGNVPFSSHASGNYGSVSAPGFASQPGATIRARRELEFSDFQSIE
jgi:hypothetical protein